MLHLSSWGTFTVRVLYVCSHGVFLVGFVELVLLNRCSRPPTACLRYAALYAEILWTVRSRATMEVSVRFRFSPSPSAKVRSHELTLASTSLTFPSMNRGRSWRSASASASASS